MRFNKLPLDISEQVTLLENRGLVVHDKESLKTILKHVSYYHLSIYFRHFLDGENCFLKNTNFEKVWNTYQFDQELRILLLQLLEKIETSLKANVINKVSLSCKNPHWLTDESQFKDLNNYNTKTTEILQRLISSKEEYLIAYFNKYSEPKTPPAWMVFESLTFGQTVLIFNQLQNKHKQNISKSFSVSYKTAGKWMHALSAIRNICAHHGRLWNKEMTTRLHIKVKGYEEIFSKDRPNRLFNYLVVMQIFLTDINNDQDFIIQLQSLIEGYQINISHMGFPVNWKERLEEVKRVVTKNNYDR